MWYHRNWALAQEKVKGMPKFALAQIADHADDKGRCWIDMDRLAFELGCDDIGSARRHRKALEDADLIKVRGRVRADGTQSSNAYTLQVTAEELEPFMDPKFDYYKDVARPGRLGRRRDIRDRREKAKLVSVFLGEDSANIPGGAQEGHAEGVAEPSGEPVDPCDIAWVGHADLHGSPVRNRMGDPCNIAGETPAESHGQDVPVEEPFDGPSDVPAEERPLAPGGGSGGRGGSDRSDAAPSAGVASVAGAPPGDGLRPRDFVAPANDDETDRFDNEQPPPVADVLAPEPGHEPSQNPGIGDLGHRRLVNAKRQAVEPEEMPQRPKPLRWAPEQSAQRKTEDRLIYDTVNLLDDKRGREGALKMLRELAVQIAQADHVAHHEGWNAALRQFGDARPRDTAEGLLHEYRVAAMTVVRALNVRPLDSWPESVRELLPPGIIDEPEPPRLVAVA